MQNPAANWSSAYEYIEQIDYIRKTILKQAYSNWIVIINSDNQIYIKFFTNVYFNHFFHVDTVQRGMGLFVHLPFDVALG